MKKTASALLLAVLLLASVEAQGSRPLPPRARASASLRIGCALPLTGEVAIFGIAVKQGIELALEERNAAGGLLGKRVELVVEDEKGDPAEAPAVYSRLTREHRVAVIIGSVMSKVSLAGAPIAQAARVPMISPTSTNPRVTAVGDYVFRACFIDPWQGNLGALYARRDLGVHRAAVLFDGGNDYTKSLATVFRASFEELGGTIVAFEAHATGSYDHRRALERIISAQPEILFIPDYYNDVALIARQVRGMGYGGLLLGGDGWDSPELAKVAGEAIEGGMFLNHYALHDPRPLAARFVESYRERFGKDPDALAALGYDSALLALDAIARAGTVDGPALRDALAASDLETVTGRIRFGDSRDPIKGGVVIEIRDGEQLYKASIEPD